MKKNSFKWAGISMFFHHSIVFKFIPHDLKNKIIVDAGCGKGINGFLMRATRDVANSKLIGFDISREYLKIAKHHNIYDKYVVGSLDKLPFLSKSIDLLMAIEVIAHLKKENGKKFLSLVDKCVKGRSIVVTPNSAIHHQPEFISSDSHHSSWTTDDFQSFGYKVYGFGLRIPAPKHRLYVPIYFACQYIFTPFTYFIPQLAGFLIAIKDF